MSTGAGGQGGNWEDLKVRLLSGAWMGAIGIGAIVAGGIWFQMLAVFVTAVMVWECWIMIRGASPTSGMLLAAGVASLMSAAVYDQSLVLAFFLLFLVVPVAIAWVWFTINGAIHANRGEAYRYPLTVRMVR